MEKLRSFFLLPVLLASTMLSLAFRKAMKPDDPVYEWTHFDRNGNPLNSYVGTVEDAIRDLGCKGSAELCAETPDIPMVLRYDPQ